MNKQGVGTRGRTRAAAQRTIPFIPFSFIRTVTVGPGITPGLLTPTYRWRQTGRSRATDWAGRLGLITAGGEFHPAPRTCCCAADARSAAAAGWTLARL